MTTWADQEAAINMRDIITQITDSRIEALRPTPTYAVVQTINREARSATVLHVGNSEPVSVAMGSIEPAQVGQTVRIGGLIGHRYIEDVLGNAITSGNDTRYAPIAHTHTEGGATEFLLDDIGDVDTATNPPGPSSVLGWNDVGGYWQPVSMDLGTSYLSLGGGTVTGPTTFQSTLAVNQTLSVLGAVTGQSFTGVGTGLTFLNATELKSGTIPSARMPPTIPSSTTGTSAGWTTARQLSMTGDVSGTVMIKGDADMSMSVALAANSIDLGTDTTGNYVQHIVGTANQIYTNSVVATEGATHTLSLPQSIDISAVPQFSRLTLGQATGTAPLAITSTTRNDNFTSHYLGLVGQDDAFFRNAGSLNAGTLANARLSGPYTGITSVGTLSTLAVTGVAALGNNSTVNGSTIWHAGNDGAGSGLDAGLLGGVLPVGYASTEIMESLLGDLLAVGLYNATAYNGDKYSLWFDRPAQSRITGLTVAGGDHFFEWALALELPVITQADLTTGENRRRVIWADNGSALDIVRTGDDDHLLRATGYASTSKTADMLVDRPVVIRARLRKTDLDAPGIRQIARHGSSVAATAYLNSFQTAQTPDTPDMEIDGRVRFLHRVRFESAGLVFGSLSSKTGATMPEREYLFYTYGGGVAFSTAQTNGAQNDFGIASDMFGDHIVGAEVAPGSKDVANLLDGVRTPHTLGADTGLPNTAALVQVTGSYDGRLYWAQMEAIDRARLMLPVQAGATNLRIAAGQTGGHRGNEFEFVARISQPDWESVAPIQLRFLWAGFGRTQICRVTWHPYVFMYQCWGASSGIGSIAAGNGDDLQIAYPTGFTPGQLVWMRFRFRGNDGSGGHSLALDYSTAQTAAEPTTWTSGGVVTKPGVIVPDQSGWEDVVGGTGDGSTDSWGGRMARFIYRNGIGATTTQLKFPGHRENYLSVPISMTAPVAVPVEFIARFSLPDWDNPVTLPGEFGGVMLLASTGAIRFAGSRNIQAYVVQYPGPSYPGIFTTYGAGLFSPNQLVWWRFRYSANGDSIALEYSTVQSFEPPTTWTVLQSGTGSALNSAASGEAWLGRDSGSAHAVAPRGMRLARTIFKSNNVTILDVAEENAKPNVSTFGATSGQAVSVLERVPTVFTFPNTLGNYLTVPYAANLNISGAMTITLDFEPLAPTRSYQVAISRMMENAWQVYMDGPSMVYYENLTGGSVIAYSTALPGYPGVARFRVAVTRVINGANVEARWFISTDSGATWTPHGTMGAGLGSPLTTTSPVLIGDQLTGGIWPMNARIRRVTINDGVGAGSTPGGTPVLDVEGHNATVGVLSFTATTGQTVSVTQTGDWVRVCERDPWTPWNPIVQGNVVRLGENDAGTMKTGNTFTSSSGHTITAFQSNQLVFPGADLNYMEVPHQANQLITDDIEILIRMQPISWRAHGWTVLGKGSGSALFFSGGQLNWYLPFSGTTPNNMASDYVPNVAGMQWLKILRRRSDGLMQFFHAPDGRQLPTAWTQIGGDQFLRPGEPMNWEALPYQFGAYGLGWSRFQGRIAHVIIRNGIGGPAVIDIHETNAYPVGGTSFTPTIGGTVNVVQTAGNKVIQAAADGPSAYVVPTAGFVSTPDPGTLPSRFHFVIKAQLPTGIAGANPQMLVSQDDAASRTYTLDRQTSGHWLFYGFYDSGGTYGATFFPGAAPITGSPETFALTVDTSHTTSAGTWLNQYQPDGSGKWVQAGAPNELAIPGLWDGTAPIRIGSHYSGTTPLENSWRGRVYSVECRTGLEPGAGNILWRFDANDYPGFGTSYVDPRGRTWNVTNPYAFGTSMVQLHDDSLVWRFDASEAATNVGRYLTPTIGVVTTPDPGPIPAECVWIVRFQESTSNTQWNWFASQPGSWYLVHWPAADRRHVGEFFIGGAANTWYAIAFGGYPGPPADGTVKEYAFAIRQHVPNLTSSAWQRVGGAWTKIYDQTDSGTFLTSVNDVNVPVLIGSNGGSPFEGRIYSVELRTGLDPTGGTVVWRFDANEAPTDGSLSWTDPRGRTWTMSAAGAISANTPSQYVDPRGRTWTLSSPTAVIPEPPSEAWTLYMDSGKLGLQVSHDGSTTKAIDVLTAAELDTISNTADNSDFYVAAAIKMPGTTLDVQGWGSPNGTAWTPFGIPKSTSFPHTSLYDSASDLTVGGQSFPYQAWDGRIYWVDMVAENTPNTTSRPMWRFDAQDHPIWTGHTYSDVYGRSWRLSASNTVAHAIYSLEAYLVNNPTTRYCGSYQFSYATNVGRTWHIRMAWDASADTLTAGWRNGEDVALDAATPTWTDYTVTHSGDTMSTLGGVTIGGAISGAQNWSHSRRMYRIRILKNGVTLLDLRNTDITTLGQTTITPTTGPVMTFSNNTMTITTMPKPIWAEGPTVYRHNMYWIVASGGEVDFVDSDLSGRYEVDVDDAVMVANGDWIVAIDPLFGAPGHEEGSDLTLSQMVFQYIPFSAETYVKAQIQEHLSDTLDPHSAAGYLKTVIANSLYAPLVHTHEAEISSFISLHEAALDPHPGYLTQAEANGYYLKPGDLLPYEPQGAILAHEQKSDPHAQYVTHAEANQDYAVVDHLHNQYAQEGHTHSQFYEIAATDGAQSARLFIGDDLPFEPRVGDLWIQTFDISLQPPAAPTNLVVSATTPTTIRLSWNAWDATVEQQSVQIERSPNGSTGWVQVFVDGGSPAATTFTDTALAQRTTYFYRVRATNLTGPGTWRVINAATGNAPPPPPTGLFVNNRTGDSVRLNWTAVTAPGNDPMHVSAPYELFRNGTFVATTADVFYDFAGLAENTEYILGVRSKDNVGVVSVLVTINSGLTANSGPPTPTGLASLDAGTNHIYLQWTPVTGISDFKEYWIRWTYYGIVVTTASSMLFSGLAPATSYSFEVAAVDTDGVASAYSPVFTTSTLGAADSTPPGPITNVSFKPRNNYGEMWFEFTAPGDVAFGQISYNVNGKEWIRVYSGGMTGYNNRLIGTFAAGSTVYVSLSYRDISYNWYYSPNYSYTLVASPSSFTPHSSNSWRPTNGGEWNAQGDYKVVEGYHSNSGLNSRGFWFYGSDFQTWWQTGRTITAARMFVAREGCGADQQDMITMYRHKLETSPGTQSFYGNAPEFSSDSHEAGTVQYNDSKWMDIPLAWASSLCAGTWRGIGIANAGKPYACLHQSGFGNSGLIELQHLG